MQLLCLTSQSSVVGLHLFSRWSPKLVYNVRSLHFYQVNYAASDAIVALHILKALMETKLSKQDQQAAVGDTVYGTPDHYMQLNSTNAIDLGTSSDENSQFEFTGQCLFGEWLMQGDNYPLVSLCQGIVDVAYQQPRRMRQVGYWQSSSCML